MNNTRLILSSGINLPLTQISLVQDQKNCNVRINGPLGRAYIEWADLLG